MTETVGVNKAGNLIRAAWQKGQREITIDGVLLTLHRSDHKVVLHDKDGKAVRKIESWIIADPKSKGLFAPVFSVELHAGKNTRVAPRTKAS